MTSERQIIQTFRKMDEAEKKLRVNRNHSYCAFHDFVGNDSAVSYLSLAVFDALDKDDHCCSDTSFALLGPASTGKTTLARMFAEAVELPFIEIQPKSVKNLDDIVVKAAKVFENTFVGRDKVSMELTLIKEDCCNEPHFLFPPCVIFIDEIHLLNNGIVQGLLQATEKKDGWLETEHWLVNCTNVCWIIATTDRGKLNTAFGTRFNEVKLKPYTKNQVAEIVRRNNVDWDISLCELVVRFAGRIPREAISFAQIMRKEAKMNGGDWEDIARKVAKYCNIDEFGMSEQRLDVIKALGKGPIAKNRLCIVANCEKEELINCVLPTMLAATEDQEPLISVSSRGYSITRAGLAELDKRNIKHRGEQALEKDDYEEIDEIGEEVA